jgi:hypothetical protein
MKVLSKVTFILTVSLLGVTYLFAQAPDTAWTRTYGGINTEGGRSIQQTTDGGYIVVGSTTSYGAGGGDVYLIKIDPLGDTLWTGTYGGINYDGGYSVRQTRDGGFIIAGETESFGAGYEGYSDVYLIKTDSLGDTLWTRTYKETDWDDEEGWSVQQTLDGGYIVAGYTESHGRDVYLIKTDSLGNTLWAKTYGGAYSDQGYSVQQTTDGGYIVVGIAEDYDVYLIKTDSLGDMIWSETYGGGGSDEGYSVQQTSDGGYVVAGYTQSFGAGAADVYLIKTDSLGDTLWTRTYGGASIDEGYSVQQTTDGGYIVVARTYSYGVGGNDFYLIKTDSGGDTLWTKTYGGADEDWGYSVQQTTDGGYIVVGITTSYGAGGGDVYLIKLKPEGSGIEEKRITDLFSLSQADPNPFTSKTTVSYELPKETAVNVSVYNMLGQKVRDLYSGKRSSGVHSVSWDGTGGSGEKLSSGIYFVRIEVEDKNTSRKVMFVR